MIASYLRKMLTLACVAAVLPACLITDRKEYEAAPSLPPSIVTDPTRTMLTLDRIIVLEDVVAPDGGSPELNFEVVVREPNVSDAVEARVFVNRPDAVTQDAIPYLRRIDGVPVNGMLERPYEFTISIASLNPAACNKIELIVAGQFAGSITPVDSAGRPSLAESARVVWWAGPRGAEISTCNL